MRYDHKKECWTAFVAVHLGFGVLINSVMASFLTWKNPESLVGFEPHSGEMQWFLVKDSNHSATDDPVKA